MVGDFQSLNDCSFFKQVAESSDDWIEVLDLDGRLRFTNQVGLRLLQVEDFTEIEGRRWLDVWPVEHHQVVQEAMAKARGGQSARFTVPYAPPMSTLRWWEVSVWSYRNEQGAMVGFFAASRDITDAQVAAQKVEASKLELKRHSAALRSAGRIARLGGWEVDLQTGVIFFTEEMWAILRVPPRPGLALDEALEFWMPESREPFRSLLTEASETGRRVTFEGQVALPDGERAWLRVFGEPAYDGETCVAIRGAAQDITDEKATYARLENADRFAQGMIDGMAAEVVVIDHTGTVVAANRATKEKAAATGRPEGFPVGYSLAELVGELPQAHRQNLSRGVRAVLNGQRSEFVHTYNAAEGSGEEWLKLHASRFDGDGPVKCVVVTQSINDVKRPERRLRKLNLALKEARDAANAASAAKSAFLATMSHEIRTPLNAVLGMAQVMRGTPLTDSQRWQLEVIHASGQALLAILNDLLDLSKVEAGKLELEDGIVDIDELACGARASFSTLISGKDLLFELRVSESARGCWRGDPARVRQVLYNLVGNALKFTDEGSVEVQISHDGESLILRVADTGPGIPVDQQPKLFDRFAQGDATNTRRHGGAGLGLAICHELASLMGGSIRLDSLLGQGSTFTARLPLVRCERRARHASEETEPALVPLSETVRVLAAEDNSTNQLVLKTLLAQIGIEPHIVENGEEALAAWRTGDWDVILMDVQMPKMDGPTAARKIREEELALGLRRTPIIAVTANAMTHQQSEYAAAGMDGFVAKPIDFALLLKTMDQAIHSDTDEADPAHHPSELVG